jgi:hypothetical protein
MQCIEDLGKYFSIRKPTTAEFFSSTSGTTIAEAVNVQHISILCICEEVRRFSHSVNTNAQAGIEEYVQVQSRAVVNTA